MKETEIIQFHFKSIDNRTKSFLLFFLIHQLFVAPTQTPPPPPPHT